MQVGRAPRRIYYGWVIVVTLALTETISWGILYYTFAVDRRVDFRCRVGCRAAH